MSFRDALQHYLDYSDDTHVLYLDEHAVIIKDLFPKASRHYLVLPRKYTHEHPLKVFKSHPEFYDTVFQKVEKAKELLIESLVREGIVENSDTSREEFSHTQIQVGIHLKPSLRNLHIHIITKDFYSPRLKNKKHYNSFTTTFFVPFDQLDPKQINTPPEDPEAVLKKDMHCINCGKNFSNKFSALKVHLEAEYKANFGKKFVDS